MAEVEDLEEVEVELVEQLLSMELMEALEVAVAENRVL
jgi:hypothetical protein